MNRPPFRVLFCCTGNALRSPMAEGLTRSLFAHAVRVDSVGVGVAPLDPFAVVVMDEIGIDISAHGPKSLDQLGETAFDLIISLTPEAQCRAGDLSRDGRAEREFWPTQDPSLSKGNRDQRLAAYRAVRDALMARIKERFKDLAPAPGAAAV